MRIIELKTSMKKIILASIFFSILLFVGAKEVNASLYIEKYDVDVVVNEDSTFDVSENISYRATGKYGTIYREITLEDKEAVEMCKENPELQCGGFSYLTVTGVYDSSGNKLPETAYTLQKVSTGGEDRLKINWVYDSNKRTFNNELFTWTVKYRVYGGLGYFDTYDMFYWDVFYPDRSYEVKDANFSIKFPSDINFDKSNLKVLSLLEDYDYNYDYDNLNYKLKVWAESLGAYEDFTVLLKYPKGIIKKPAKLKLDLDPKTQNLWIDGKEILNVKDEFAGIPPGRHDLRFEASGYKPHEVTIDLEEGQVKNIESHLEMTAWKKVAMIAIVVANICSCFGGLVFIGFLVVRYMNKGRDIGGQKTIVPWFKPPEGISPVIVGSIKDEKVHTTDITSTIINAAVRGFLKIKEIGKKKYELIKLKGFESGETMTGRKMNYDVLESVEVDILRKIFDGKDKVKTEDLKNKFYLKIPKINDKVYEEMVERKYFAKRPDKVRRNNFILGGVILALGVVLTFVLSFLTIFTCGPSLIVVGIAQLILASFMPAKTNKGTEIYEKCKGFRMFLHTAERYRMQNLTPEKFERFLPYAMVFGVEKEWAKNFEDIYTQAPDWYEGRSGWTTFRTMYLVNSLSSMNSNVGKVMASAPRSSGSSGWSGGGWSGGGGFSGGFSGGGGGGGGGGMS